MLPARRTLKGSARAEVYCSGWTLSPHRKGAATRLSFVTCIQSGHGPAVPVVCHRMFNDHHAIKQMENLMDWLKSPSIGELDHQSGVVIQ